MELQEHKRIIEEQKPKVAFADSVSNSNDLILVRDLAKIISQNGITIGENAMIGVGSVVTHDVPSGELWYGNPARFVRKLKNKFV